ncbi:MAG: sodium:solute symporter family protein [Actinomycetota bacterium]|nr:sodium:solute symporter family protein [Actinomycetota bacterium]
MGDIKVVELLVFLFFFILVTVLGFVASRWRRAATLDNLDEWGLGGRNFGAWITWFLIGGDLYTAYTFVAVPALIYGAGALGFFAVPYTIIVYPMVFLVAVRLWSVSHRHGYVTPADFVRGRHGSPTLALMIALTGIVATMPYIALQLIGIEAVLKTIGLHGEGIVGDLPIIIAFVILAAYTYQSGLRAPALIAFVKDTLIYIVVLAAIVYIPIRLGGWEGIFAAADKKFAASPAPGDGTLLSEAAVIGYSTLAFGSALALFLYPHSITALLASGSRDVIKRNMAALPAYSFVLGLLALLGYMAIAAGITPIGADPDAGVAGDRNTVVPLLYDAMFPDWFAGVAFAAIAIGALVPAAIMSIAAANLWTRNIYKEYINKDATPQQEATMSKLASLVVKVGAVAVILFLDPSFSIDFQLIGGVLILQTLPAIVLGLYTRWWHHTGLLAGWAAGIVSGLWMLWVTQQVAPDGTIVRAHFGGALFALSDWGIDTRRTIYTGVIALLVNLLVAALVTAAMRAMKMPYGHDATREEDYHVEAGDPAVEPLPVSAGQAVEADDGRWHR